MVSILGLLGHALERIVFPLGADARAPKSCIIDLLCLLFTWDTLEGHEGGFVVIIVAMRLSGEIHIEETSEYVLVPSNPFSPWDNDKDAAYHGTMQTEFINHQKV
jgi:hypothetical protein